LEQFKLEHTMANVAAGAPSTLGMNSGNIEEEKKEEKRTKNHGYFEGISEAEDEKSANESSEYSLYSYCDRWAADREARDREAAAKKVKTGLLNSLLIELCDDDSKVPQKLSFFGGKFRNRNQIQIQKQLAQESPDIFVSAKRRNRPNLADL